MHQATIGVRVVGQLPATLDYCVEMAVQTGSLGPTTCSAWAGHWHRAASRSPARRRVRGMFGEFNFASGDANPTDGTRGTFDQLYPTRPRQVRAWPIRSAGRTSTTCARASSSRRAADGRSTGSYHSWWLAERHRRALQRRRRASSRASPAGAAARHVGQEIDVQVSHALTPQLQIAGGYAHIVPGAFLKQHDARRVLQLRRT